MLNLHQPDGTRGIADLFLNLHQPAAAHDDGTL
jgi:hypothetical protein